MSRWCAAILGVLLLVLSATSAWTQPPDTNPKGTARVSGMLVFKEKLDFLPGTMVEVTIREDTKAVRPESPLGQQVIRDARTAPILFAVEYNPADVRAGARYSVHARLFNGRETHYTSSPDVPVLTEKNPSRGLRVFMIPVK